MAAAAQLPDYQLSLIQEQEGLKTADLITIAKDREGYMWLASQGHVQRFDGRHTLHFPFRETVNKMIVDARNRKWVVTRQGIHLFVNSYRGFKQIPVGPANENTSANLYEINERIYAVNPDGYYTYDDKKEMFQPGATLIENTKARPNRYIGKQGEVLFFNTRDAVLGYHLQTKQTTIARIPFIYSVIPLNPDELLVSTRHFETFYVSMKTGQVQLLGADQDKKSPAGNNLLLHSGVKLHNGCYLLSSNKGLFEFDCRGRVISKPVFYHNGRPLENQQSITSFYKDPDGTIYMNHADGIFFLNNSSFIQYFRNYRTAGEKMPDNDVRNFAEDEAGNIWMATTNGISRLNMQSGDLKVFEPLSKTNSIDFPSYRQLLNDGNYIWIGTSGNGVWYYDKRTGTYQRPFFPNTEEAKKQENAFNVAYIWEILKLKDNRLLLVGGTRSFLIDPVTRQASQASFTSASFNSRSAMQDSSGRIWHGSVRGLACMDNNFKDLFFVRDSFPDKRVASFCEWKKDKMLVGSKGLYEVEVKENRIIAFTHKKSIPSERLIYCMKQDRQGFVWLGTDEGIFRYDPLKDEAVMFDQSDHVQSQAFNSDAAFLSSTGLLFMGGKNGVNYFDPSAYTHQPEQLYPLVSSFAVNADDSSYFQTASNYRIPYNSRNIDFIISAPEFKKPFRVQYRYRLNNGTNGWTPTGFNNRIRISKLLPGKYQLQVSASYDGKNWFDSDSTVSFTVLKPWWQTGWFRLLCVIAIAFAIWTLLWYRRKRREAAELKRTIEYFTYSGSADSSAELILWDIARNCISRLGFEDCVIYLLDEKRNMLVQKAAYGDKNPKAFEIANPIEIPVGKGITGYVAQTGKAVVIPDTSKDERYIVDDEKRLSELAVPIIHDGKLIGVIDSENSRKHFFTPHHLKTLQTISSLCASKIATAIAVEAAKKAEHELQLLNGKMMESKFMNLRLQMNPHFLFNILTSIQYLIVSQQVTKATNYLNIFSGFLRSLLNFAEETVVTLEEELRILAIYVELESLCLDETFVWEVEVDEEIDQEEVLVPFMLLQPFVENAINHGLIHKIGEKRFHISIRENDPDSLICIIGDNGIGREAAAVIKQKNLSTVLHQSKAISIVKERLELLQQKTAKKAGFEIEDLFENGKASGTRVRIIIPYYTKEET